MESKGAATYKHLDPDGSEYGDLYRFLVPIMETHLSGSTKFNAGQNAAILLSTYDRVMMDFWTKETADKALRDLKQAVSLLDSAYSRVPELVVNRLDDNTTSVDEFTKQRFLKETERNLLLSHMLPERGAACAFEALKSLSQHCAEFISAIDLTRRELPNGFPTRNRPNLQEWALIDACVHLARIHKTMGATKDPDGDVPKSVDEYGDLARFLKDVFAVFGIKKESFKTVYSSWKKYMDGKYEQYDLLTM